MRASRTGEAIQQLIQKLRPFTLEVKDSKGKEEERFAMPDGTELCPLGQENGVLMLSKMRAGLKPAHVPAGEYAGMVMVRPETDEERQAANLPSVFAHRRVILGLAPETRDVRGRLVAYPIADTAIAVPNLITD